MLDANTKHFGQHGLKILVLSPGPGPERYRHKTGGLVPYYPQTKDYNISLCPLYILIV
jgi:hypothetical protein